MACPSVDSLSNTTFANTCLIGNVQSNKQLQDAMKTCCGSSTISEFDNGCINYCNITTLQDSISWNFCLQDTLDPSTYETSDVTCFVPPEKVQAASNNASVTGVIATTWTAQDKNFTKIATIDGAPETFTINPVSDYAAGVSETILPSKAATSTGASSTDVSLKWTGTSSAPSATKSTSVAVRDFSISKLMVAALGGVLVFGLL